MGFVQASSDLLTGPQRSGWNDLTSYFIPCHNYPRLCFTTAVFDLVPLAADYRDGTAAKTHPQYPYRPWKTILVRTVADGGRSYYFCGDHRVTISTLHRRVIRAMATA